MRKSKKILLLSMLSIIALTSCGGNENGGGSSVTENGSSQISTPTSTPDTTPSSTTSESTTPTTTSQVETKYTITSTESEDYTISGLADEATEGTDISFTVTITDEAKHSIKAVKYNNTEITRGEDGSYAFVMPAENVTISVELEVKSYSITSVIYSSSYDYYTPSVDLDLTKEYKVGETVTFTMSFKTTFSAKFAKNMGYFVNDEGYQIDYTSTDGTTSLTGLTFTMPAEDVELAFMPISPDVSSGTSKTKKIVIDEKPAGIRVYSSEKFLFDTTSSSYFSNNITVKREDGWVISKVTYKRENDEEWQTLNISNLSWKNNIAQLGVTSIKLDGDIHFKIEGHLAQTYNLTIVNGDKVTFKSTPATSYVEGDDVSLEFSAADDTQIISYKIDGATNTASSYYQSSQIKFKMPGNNVTITFSSQTRGKITLPTDENITKIYASTSSYGTGTVTSLDPGKTFYVFVTTKDGYSASGAHLNGGDAVTGKTYSGQKYFQFTMPESGDATITVDVVKNGTISVATNDKIDGDVFYATSSYVSSSTSSYVKASNAFASGDTVYVLAKAVTGYSLGTATLTVDGLEDQTLTASTNSYGYYYWTFKMPANQKNASLTISTITNGSITVTGDSTYFDDDSFTIKSSLYGDAVASNAISPSKTFYVFAKFKEGVTGYSLGTAQITGSESTVTPTESSTYGTYYTFTMPASGDVSITVNVVKNGTIDISAHADVSEFKIGTSTSYPTTSAGNNDFAPGKTFYVFAKPNEGKKVTKATLKDGTNDDVEVTATYGTGYSYFKFTMPTNGVANISFETANSHTATLDTTVTGLTLSKSSGLDSNNAAAVGDTVVVKASASYGYTIKTIVAKAEGHDDIALTKNSSGSYEFTMPDYDVTISGTVEALASASITVKGTTLPSTVSSAYVYVSGNNSAPEFSYGKNGKNDTAFTWLVGDKLTCTYYDTSSSSYSENLAIVVTKTDGTTVSYDMTMNNYGTYIAYVTVEAGFASIEWKVVAKTTK